MKNFCIEQHGNAEILALIGEVLGAVGVNIEGLCLATCDDLSVVHFVVEDAATARHVLETSGIEIKEMSEVFVLEKDRKGITGKPGSFGDICKKLADHGIRIKFAYPAENNRFVFGVDDVANVRALLE